MTDEQVEELNRKMFTPTSTNDIKAGEGEGNSEFGSETAGNPTPEVDESGRNMQADNTEDSGEMLSIDEDGYAEAVKNGEGKYLADNSDINNSVKELYENVLKGDFNSVTLQQINDYINETRNENHNGWQISERIPQGASREVAQKGGIAAVDALFSRICESSVRPNERTRPEGRRRI